MLLVTFLAKYFPFGSAEIQTAQSITHMMCSSLYYDLTCGMWWASDVNPRTSIKFSCKSSLSELELKTHWNLRLLEGLAMTSQETRIFSRFATPYIWTWLGLQSGLTASKKTQSW